ncbi:hypothetical protein I5907_08175 [Panacibacter sp. DH6]|uniref:Oxygen sensor histidine kinase NreB n=1 Tax=Panacibacter microcysteis TaxID=2793269 RepID=A0A931E6Y4_9BACT|nr:ATP-binding protein [Panacibacter microcysteis]MBG9376208.1 hypothetical protein [Panacibacter microcysteis]
MPNSSTEEVLITIVTIVIVFLVLAGIIIFILYRFQKDKFKHKKEFIELEKKFIEQSLQSQLEIQEHTFNTISQEIHDNVGQILSLAKVQVSIVEHKETKDTATLKELRENIGQAMNDLRDIAKSLSSERIQLLRLHETVAHEMQRINRTGLINIVINTTGNEQHLEVQKKLILFRIIQESIQNIIKHAKASDVEILFNYAADKIDIAITDNGTGFDTAAALQKNGGLGLQNIISRATLIGGSAVIDSVIDKGTSIKISIPYA